VRHAGGSVAVGPAPYWDGQASVNPFRQVDDHDVRTAALSAIPRDSPMASGTGGPPVAAGVLGSSAFRIAERGMTEY